MKNESLFFTEHERNTEEHSRIYASEELTFNVTEDLLIIMEDKDISKTDLAVKLGKTKAYISQLLSGSKNMTLKTMSDVCFALGIKPSVDFKDIEDSVVSDSTVKKFVHINWETYCVEEDKQSLEESEQTIVTKSNIVYRPEKHLWQKAAA
ncbi:helix-turn-helix transcriptional regulator [Rahnella sp. CJA17(1/100)]|uniref:helix-turn-helix domain-containing protein n=1 Tax=Rahnella sp. CJA17(1/100) TaxID=2508951 RepID=UPI0010704727|nr:helix-turn-helix transcriptional regulator [Rahnella sp. CJA17(1/100)]